MRKTHMTAKNAEYLYDFQEKVSHSYKLYHYTSTKVLGILLEDPTFRAAHLKYMNDSEEYIWGLEQVKKICRLKNTAIDDVNINSGIYSISFCEDGNLLSQWAIYAKESGVAIELDYDLLQKKDNESYFVLRQKIEDDKMYQNMMNLDNPTGVEDFDSTIWFDPIKVLKPIIYGDASVKKNKARIINAKLDEQIDECDNENKIRLVAAYCKNVGFQAEREVRAAFFRCKTEADYYGREYLADLDYVETNHSLLRPFLKIQFCHVKMYGEKFVPCLPLKSITIGPSGIQQSVFNSIVHRIEFGRKNIYDYSCNKNAIFLIMLQFMQEICKYLMINEKISFTVKRENPEAKEIIDFIASDKELKFRSKGQIDLIDLVKYFIKARFEEYEEKWLEDLYEQFGCGDFKFENLQVVKIIKENFYMSKEGIIVRKSSIPYIF